MSPSLRERLISLSPLSTKRRDALPASKFAYVDAKGNGHLPIGDAAHVRNAFARFDQTEFPSESAAKSAWGKLLAAAKRYGIKHDGAMPSPRKSAAASARAVSGIALCAAVALEGDEPPEWIELIPAGTFDANDGRGPFFNRDPEGVVARTRAAMRGGLALDYDHATDRAAPQGLPAPAAAWIRDFRVIGGAIQGRIEWTERGAAAVKAKEYRFISPVFSFTAPEGWDEKTDVPTGAVKLIMRAALTNNPALSDLPAVAASQGGVGAMAKDQAAADGGEGGGAKKLSEIIATLESANPDATPEQLMAAAVALMGDGDGDADMDAADGDPDGSGTGGADPYADESEEQMAARHASEMSACATDDARAAMSAKHAAQMEKKKMAKSAPAAASATMTEAQLVAKHPMVVKMARELSEVRTATAAKNAETKVDEAIKDGRLVPAQREWAVAYCSADPKGFDAFIAKQPKIVAAGVDGTITAIAAGTIVDEHLPPEAKAICENLGLTREQFIAAAKTRKRGAAVAA